MGRKLLLRRLLGGAVGFVGLALATLLLKHDTANQIYL